MREREGIFSDFVSDLRRKEKEEKSHQKEKVCIGLMTAGSFLFIKNETQYADVLNIIHQMLRSEVFHFNCLMTVKCWTVNYVKCFIKLMYYKVFFSLCTSALMEFEFLVLLEKEKYFLIHFTQKICFRDW